MLLTRFFISLIIASIGAISGFFSGLFIYFNLSSEFVTWMYTFTVNTSGCWVGIDCRFIEMIYWAIAGMLIGVSLNIILYSLYLFIPREKVKNDYKVIIG